MAMSRPGPQAGSLKQSVVPLPAAPVKYAPFVFAGWAIAAIVLTYVMRRSNRGGWVERAGEIFEEVLPHTQVPVENRIGA